MKTPGLESARVFLIGSVPLLHPEVQTVDEMLDGWRNQQLWQPGTRHDDDRILRVTSKTAVYSLSCGPPT